MLDKSSKLVVHSGTTKLFSKLCGLLPRLTGLGNKLNDTVLRGHAATKRSSLLLAGVAMAVGLSACSSSSSTTTTVAPSSSHASKPAASTSSSATVDAYPTSKYGTILRDSSGYTLYAFSIDTPTKSACLGSCAVIWHPLEVTGTSTAGSGVRQSLLGTITRPGGAKQVTYDGHPLYTFAKDTAPGDINGEGINHFGGLWWVVSTKGAIVTAPVTTTKSSSSYSSPSATY